MIFQPWRHRFVKSERLKLLIRVEGLFLGNVVDGPFMINIPSPSSGMGVDKNHKIRAVKSMTYSG